VPTVDSPVRIARAATERLTLPLRRGFRGVGGNVPGASAGSSIDFQDHRAYVPGDDPRHIDWLAYARSGHYVMKLYREEVRPLVDILLDASESMTFDADKRARSLELAAFAIESAHRAGAGVRLFTARGPDVTARDPIETDWLSGSDSRCAELPAVNRVPWRAGSLRVFISDLLAPVAPAPLLAPLASARGRVIVFAVASAAEADPDWIGNTELEDCETSRCRDHRFRDEDLRNYRSAYVSHFSAWRDECRRHAAVFTRVLAGGELVPALLADALPAGAVELV